MGDAVRKSLEQSRITSSVSLRVREKQIVRIFDFTREAKTRAASPSVDPLESMAFDNGRTTLPES